MCLNCLITTYIFFLEFRLMAFEDKLPEKYAFNMPIGTFVPGDGSKTTDCIDSKVKNLYNFQKCIK